ncbi:MULTISPECIES: hypothetical protein [unclassified Mesorhizobium]|uniref:hypothetical protein n=1 Tax=unclassified Mesorhizobium TaxID=325217 RepID=UPI000FD6F748|nr:MULTISPECIES: hypothetical protein [unclassified Mesorhizobium]TGQ11602.1 hypothetical protein EN862_011615 [Mesorhizobium sp. M2E.F.Ca.ET.219.01.1.1]TGT70240.1 hypothetical protein EN809_019960 [Mesorhizobium sp. M2E.F.Ca.ET.166.01.1.1]TGV98474.1 hypothetical protein EN797_026150 [Mesorhizobium sp. M2E.F.Ca.ET.154.01.1.1]
MNGVQEKNEQRSQIELLNGNTLDASFARPGVQENNETLDKLSFCGDWSYTSRPQTAINRREVMLRGGERRAACSWI